MATPDTETLQTHIEQSAALLIATLSGLSEERARTRPAEDRWSVLEIVEHVLLVDARFRARIEEGPRLSALVHKSRRGQTGWLSGFLSEPL